MESDKFTGSCLCGTVKFEITPPLSGFRYCHCSRCRKATGSAHAANIFLPESQFAWTAGEASVKRFNLPGAQRFSVWFCTNCGTRMPHKIPSRGDYLIPAGVLDQDPGKRPENSIFWASKAAWYVEPGQHPRHAEYT
ncbi:MAG TPA: GFA family protein [Burkholderiales bacterium]|nr:GFA family protein [Burkholderiales bacterium]